LGRPQPHVRNHMRLCYSDARAVSTVTPTSAATPMPTKQRAALVTTGLDPVPPCASAARAAGTVAFCQADARRGMASEALMNERTSTPQVSRTPRVPLAKRRPPNGAEAVS
jgi:hypothetical protein